MNYDYGAGITVAQSQASSGTTGGLSSPCSISSGSHKSRPAPYTLRHKYIQEGTLFILLIFTFNAMQAQGNTSYL
jgi:hypothetical protein